jgi:2-polyprenyl-3-methyl-5-hydroxy-6-metoxy-1,4-benzoquinol methylase
VGVAEEEGRRCTGRLSGFDARTSLEEMLDEVIGRIATAIAEGTYRAGDSLPGMPEPPPERGTPLYDFTFGPETPYAHAMALVEQCRIPQGEVVVDLGCGFGAIAEPTRALGLAYLGIDREPSGIRSLVERGAEALVADLSTPESLVATLSGALEGRRVAAITMLDSAEHLPNAAGVLGALSAFSRSAGGAPLVVSIPNVSHRDVAAKLLLGRWDVTPTGLLDETHVRFFAPATLERQMRETGWEEIGARDFPLEVSDQFFPDDCVALLPWTPLGALLHRVRGQAAPGATTNQFVRAYRPTALPEASAGATNRARPAGGPFLSVVVRSRGSDSALQATLAALEQQDLTDLEVFVLGEAADGPHDIDRVVAGAGGRYVALLNEGDAPAPGWTASLNAGAAVHPGRVLRVGVRGEPPAGEGGLFELFSDPPAALAPYALPRSLFAHLGMRVEHRPSDGSSPPLDAPTPDWLLAEWLLLVRAVELCGLVPLEGVGFARLAPSAHGEQVTARRAALCAVLDEHPMILGRGTASVLAELHRRATELERARDDADRRLAEVYASTSWRLTAPLRAALAWHRHR